MTDERPFGLFRLITSVRSDKLPRAGLIVLLVAFASMLAWAGSWREKDWHEWSWDDCLTVLYDSPWGQLWTFERGPGSEDSNPGGHVGCNVYFRSALPIRQALARFQELSRQGVHGRLLFRPIESGLEDPSSGNFRDQVVIRVVYGVNMDPRSNQEIALAPASPETAVLIFPNGRRVAPKSAKLLHQSTDTIEFELVFPRVIDGHPLLNPTDKSLDFKYGSNYGTAPFTFKIDKMLFQGKLEF